ncbi:tyrosine-protein phosphatase [Catellatospora sp. TT07R-123]|uniref:tyrosine-protein phosphatase n=1 Tax=Catellatospora sp. TT07R-123 TaxID=2733863 RepID=UPI001FD277CA|nr:tyrosine-protein phosphatase [Catellatospora sp. TT07R-123]
MSRHVPFQRVRNFRDLGGYRTADGRTVAWGRLYRSDTLGKFDDDDWAAFLALGVRTVIDLRYPWEIERGGRVREHDSFTWHNLSVEHRPYKQASQGPEVDPVPFLAGKYAEVAEDGVAELATALRLIAGEGDGPLVFHCYAGKDRTGIVAALVLSLLDVPEDVIVADFALTGLITEHLVADITARMGRPPVWPGYGRAPEGVMRLFLADLTERYGSVRGYAEQRLGVDEPLVQALRTRLLEP